MDNDIYPLRFRPVLKEVVWGGRRLETVLGKRLPAEAPIGESWEISPHPDGVSVVQSGPLAGKSLPEAVVELKERLVGTAVCERYGDTFPLLVKFIDAKDVLSVQVHPDAEYARAHGAAPKTEAWYVIDVAPGAEIIRGVKPGTTKERFTELLDAGRLAECLNSFEVHPGDTIFIPAGTIHAIGKGVLLAEVQQNSDTTYRVFDWNRVGLDGQPRQLHVEDALNVAAFSTPDADTVPSGAADEAGRVALVDCDKFVMKRWEVPGVAEAAVSPDLCEMLSVLAGKGEIMYGGGAVAVECGASVLLPAALGEYKVKAEETLTILWSCPR